MERPDLEAADRVQKLQERLNALGRSLEKQPGALALIGLGSVGNETTRLDEWSDLDFFVMAEQTHVPIFIASIDWLESVCPITFAFRNTVDGWKVLFEDGIYAEFAVFDKERMKSIPFAGPRVVWQAEGVELSDVLSKARTTSDPPAADWLIGELVTNLYVGLCRFRRGEKLSAQRLIEGHAVDRLVDLWTTTSDVPRAFVDAFDLTRRVEQRQPGLASLLPSLIQGYDHVPDSAMAILDSVQSRFDVNAALADRIVELADECRQS